MHGGGAADRCAEGLAVIVGRSHPGVERILEAATRIDPNLCAVTMERFKDRFDRVGIGQTIKLP
jgi:hypothetical protein